MLSNERESCIVHLLNLLHFLFFESEILSKLTLASFGDAFDVNILVENIPWLRRDDGQLIRWIGELGHLQAQWTEELLHLRWCSVVNGEPFR